MINSLLITILLGLPSMSIHSADQFPARPLVGTFELYSSTPPIDGVDSRDLQPEIFQAGQRMRIEYMGEYGSERPEREVYRISLLPPFDKGFCLRPNWKYSCPSYNGRQLVDSTPEPPTTAISSEANLDTWQIKTDKEVNLNAQFVPYGLKRGDFIYALTFTDSRANYGFFFKDWNTIISQSAYKTQPGDQFVFVDQVLKRVIAP